MIETSAHMRNVLCTSLTCWLVEVLGLSSHTMPSLLEDIFYIYLDCMKCYILNHCTIIVLYSRERWRFHHNQCYWLMIAKYSCSDPAQQHAQSRHTEMIQEHQKQCVLPRMHCSSSASLWWTRTKGLNWLVSHLEVIKILVWRTQYW